MQGFVVYGGVGGGFCAGFGTQLLEHLAQEYKQKTQLAYFVYPSMSDTNVQANEVYNNMLATQKILEENTNTVVMLDNHALGRICASVNIEPSF